MRISDWSSDVCSSDLSRASAALARRRLCVAVLLRLRFGHLGQRPPPAFVTAGDGPFQALHGVGALGDARLPGNGFTPLVVELPPDFDQPPARAPDHMGQRSAEVDLAGPPLTILDPFVDALAAL